MQGSKCIRQLEVKYVFQPASTLSSRLCSLPLIRLTLHLRCSNRVSLHSYYMQNLNFKDLQALAPPPLQSHCHSAVPQPHSHPHLRSSEGSSLSVYRALPQEAPWPLPACQQEPSQMVTSLQKHAFNSQLERPPPSSPDMVHIFSLCKQCSRQSASLTVTVNLQSPPTKHTVTLLYMQTGKQLF